MTHKILPFFFVLFVFPLLSAAQCESTLTPFEEYTLQSVSSEDGANVAANALDGNVETLFRTLGNTPFPHELQIDLGSVRAVTQLILTPPPSNSNGKLAEYEVYVSVDGEDWGEAQAAGLLVYEGFGDTQNQIVDFGAVDGRYVRLVALSMKVIRLSKIC